MKTTALKRNMVAQTVRLFGAALIAVGMAGSALPFVQPVHAQDQEISEEHVRLAARYAELSGANLLYINALNAQRRDIIRVLGGTNPDIVELITEVTDAAYLEMADNTGPLFQDVAEIYARAYPMSDLEVIVAFFESDVGQRFLEVRREVDQEAFAATVEWGDSISVLFLERVRTMLAERGVDL